MKLQLNPNHIIWKTKTDFEALCRNKYKQRATDFNKAQIDRVAPDIKASHKTMIKLTWEQGQELMEPDMSQETYP